MTSPQQQTVSAPRSLLLRVFEIALSRIEIALSQNQFALSQNGFLFNPIHFVRWLIRFQLFRPLHDTNQHRGSQDEH